MSLVPKLLTSSCNMLVAVQWSKRNVGCVCCVKAMEKKNSVSQIFTEEMPATCSRDQASQRIDPSLGSRSPRNRSQLMKIYQQSPAIGYLAAISGKQLNSINEVKKYSWKKTCEIMDTDLSAL